MLVFYVHTHTKAWTMHVCMCFTEKVCTMHVHVLYRERSDYACTCVVQREVWTMYASVCVRWVWTLHVQEQGLDCACVGEREVCTTHVCAH